VIGAVETGALNMNNVREDEIVAHLVAGMERLHARFGLSTGSVFNVCAGVAGIKEDGDSLRFDGLLDRAYGERMLRRESVNDIVILQAAGLGERPGIALILGTGSHCYGRNGRGETATCGGWGYLMDDGGGGYAIGHAALRMAVRMWDGRKQETPLARHVLEYLGIGSPEASLHRVHNTGFGFDDVKALAPLVVRWAQQGDEAALEILQQAAADGAELVEVVCRKLDLGNAPGVVITGGVALNDFFRCLLDAEVRQRMPQAELIVPTLPPVAGALIRAAMAIGLPVTREFTEAIEQSSILLEYMQP
jgi:N-acetylglucosamine kinase-like BadF-type ATPase